MSCPICKKRKPERYCPAKGEKICAICCGTEREVTIDCPADCTYLVAAHRYEEAQRKPLEPDKLPFPEVEISSDLVHELRPVVSGLAFNVLKYAGEHPSFVDLDALGALSALAETYRTLGSGIYYEKPPDALLPRGLYDELNRFIETFKRQDAERTGFTSLKDGDVFRLLVFLLRVGRHRTNGRPRARIFLEFLRAQFPQGAVQREAPRIIAP